VITPNGVAGRRTAASECKLLAHLSYSCGIKTPCRGRAEGRVSEATVSRVLNGKPGVSEATRAAVLTALDVLATNGPPSCAGSGPAGRPGAAELQNPIFPAFADVSETRWPSRVSPQCCALATAGGVSEPSMWSCCCSSTCPCGVRRRAVRPGRRLHEHTCGSPTGNCRPCWSTPPSRTWPSRGRLRRRGCRRAGLGHLLSLGHTRVGMVLGRPTTCPRAASKRRF